VHVRLRGLGRARSCVDTLTALRLLANLVRTRSLFLAFYAAAHEILGHRWRGGVLSCPCPRYDVVITQLVDGRPVGRLRVLTCARHDPGW
jgi:hypothetical protein